jgi:hypothetical protein
LRGHVKKIRQAKFTDAKLKPPVGQFAEQGKRRAGGVGFSATERNDLVPHQPSDAGAGSKKTINEKRHNVGTMSAAEVRVYFFALAVSRFSNGMRVAEYRIIL